MRKRDLSAIRKLAGSHGGAARWGEARPPSRTVRVDADAADLLATVAERDRRRVASDGIRRAVADYARDVV